MTTAVMIPVLPCQVLDETLAFYVALGFTRIEQQTQSHQYGGVQWGEIELHFLARPDYEPANSYSGCYMRVADVDTLYQEFMARLHQSYGPLPSVGLPRVIPLKNQSGNRREFMLIDPGGNQIRIGQVLAVPASAIDDESQQLSATNLERARSTANFLVEHRNDYAGAAETLDAALWQAAAAPAIQRIPALVMRAGLAIALGDLKLGRTLLLAIRQLPLHEDERATLVAELQTAAELERRLP